MKALMMLAAGCILAIGFTACETKTEEPATVDTTAMAPVDSVTIPASDTVSGTPVDTVLLDRKDTAIITQDTTIKPGKTATTGDVKKTGKTSTKPVVGEAKPTDSKTRRNTGGDKPTESEVRRTPPTENTSTESKPRR